MTRLLDDHPCQWCWACGRDERQKPDWWHGVWFLHRAHLSAGSGGMARVDAEWAVVLLCPLCHMVHWHHDGLAVRVCGHTIPRLTDAMVLWLKRERDALDIEQVRKWWTGEPPEPVEPDKWFLDQYEMRRGVPWKTQ